MSLNYVAKSIEKVTGKLRLHFIDSITKGYFPICFLNLLKGLHTGNRLFHDSH